ncbi:MAG: maleylpyruvate isomerase family mycothiol-dependent enzyme [Anaerolineales bacterium]|nr:maleylpyruvate isomerase family mycothiol-dependent enzyme [Anaerolineales bacterium]
MQAPQPILITHLFPEILSALLELLDNLRAPDWQAPTICDGWTVKDIALHLLAVEISNLSRKRDGHSLQPPQPLRTAADLLAFINELNDSWMQAARRISAPLLIDLLHFTGQQTNEYFASLDPFTLGEPVSWVGPEPAPVWLDLAREYTERWHHQQHIRDAVGQPGLKTPHYLEPVLDTFARAMPHTYRQVAAPVGTSITLTLTGPGGGRWTVQQEGAGWQLYSGAPDNPAAEVLMAGDDAWRLFTGGLEPFELHERVEIRGNAQLGAQVLEMVSIIA